MAQQPRQPQTAVPPLFSNRVKITAAALAIGLAGWWGAATLGRSQIQVIADAQPLTCSGTEIVFDSLFDDEDRTIPYAVVREPMRCLFQFWVENRGPLPATVDRITMLWYGPDRGSEVEAVRLLPAGAEPLRQDQVYNGNAVFVLDPPVRIGRGEARRFKVELVYRPPGCRAAEGTSMTGDNPVARVSVLGLTGRRPLAGVPFGLRCVRD
jgi:hypothetical protein